MEPVHFPIPDVSVPADGHALRQLVDRIVWRLRQGRTAVVHCKGGLGRSGTVAAAVLVLLGEEPRRAIARVRAARRGAIETFAQEAAVENFPELCGAGVRWERIAGCLLGGAVGDALGAGIEFDRLAAIRQRFGPAGVTDYVAAYGRRGAITDDTQMTLFTAEGLLRAAVRYREKGICHPPSVVHHALLRWLHTQGMRSELLEDLGKNALEGALDGWLHEVEALHSRRAPGNTCVSSLVGVRRLGDHAVNDSKGCGDIMRSAPCGLLGDSYHGDVFDLAAECSKLTHGHRTGHASAGYFAEVIHELAAGIPLREAAEAVLARRSEDRLDDDTRYAVESALAAADAAGSSPPSPEAVERLGAGWTSEEALAIGLYSALVAMRDAIDGPECHAASSDRFRRGVVLAVNHSGDSDSTGSIAGNLLGAALGVSAIPKEWLDELELREVIETVARDLWAVGEGAALDWQRYPGW
jgi:ADP-ribosyl-[dinitrogen reductase] hydrolase